MEQIEQIKQQFDISALGFLPAAPLPETPNPLWEQVAQNLATQKVSLAELPEFTWHEPKRAYALLTVLTNKYLQENPGCATLPSKIAVPLWQVSQQLGIKPTLTHASVDLFNWTYIDPQKGFYLENLKSNYTLSQFTHDESWFYLVMVAIEGLGAPILQSLIKLSLYPTKPVIYETLTIMYSTLIELTNIIRKMYIHCRPDVFYNEIRQYLGGPKNISFESVPELQNVSFTGGSAAQSTLIPCIDAALNITHNSPYFSTITDYMPAKHAQFIEYVKQNVTPHLTNRTEKAEQMHAKCKRALTQFREAHMQLAEKYILQFIPPNKNAKGTGDTELKTFLRETINETKQ